MVENTRLKDLEDTQARHTEDISLISQRLADTERILSELKVSVDSIAQKYDEWAILFPQLIKDEKETPLEVSFEDNCDIGSVNKDDQLFATLVAGDPVIECTEEPVCTTTLLKENAGNENNDSFLLLGENKLTSGKGFCYNMANEYEPLDFELEEPISISLPVTKKKKKLIGLDDLLEDYEREQKKIKEKEYIRKKIRKTYESEDDVEDAAEAQLSVCVDQCQKEISQKNGDDEMPVWGIRVFGNQKIFPQHEYEGSKSFDLLQSFMNHGVNSLVNLNSERGEDFLEGLLVKGWLLQLVYMNKRVEKSIATWTFNLILLFRDKADAFGLRIDCLPKYLDLKRALDMAGFSITVMKADQIILNRLDAPTKAPNWPVGTDGDHPPTKILVPLVPSLFKKSTETSSRLEKLSPGGRILEIAIEAAATAVINLWDCLNDWDNKVGDGDCGSTMFKGASAILEDMESFLSNDGGDRNLYGSLKRSINDQNRVWNPGSADSNIFVHTFLEFLLLTCHLIASFCCSRTFSQALRTRLVLRGKECNVPRM